MTDGTTGGTTGLGALLEAVGPGAGVFFGAGRPAAAFLAGFLAEAFLAGFLAAAFLALDFFPDALRTVFFLRLEALRFAFFLATVVPP